MNQVSVDDICRLMEAVAKYNITQFIVATDNFKLSIEGKTVEGYTAPVAPMGAPAAAPSAEPQITAKTAEKIMDGNIIKSPIVGTFYIAPAPDKPPFIAVGKEIKQGDVLFIIESMKLMNEVQSDCSGRIAEIFVENGQPVEFGQPIVRIVQSV